MILHYQASKNHVILHYQASKVQMLPFKCEAYLGDKTAVLRELADLEHAFLILVQNVNTEQTILHRFLTGLRYKG